MTKQEKKPAKTQKTKTQPKKVEVKEVPSTAKILSLGEHLKNVRAKQDASKPGLIVIKGPLYPPRKTPKNLKGQRGK